MHVVTIMTRDDGKNNKIKNESHPIAFFNITYFSTQWALSQPRYPMFFSPIKSKESKKHTNPIKEEEEEEGDKKKKKNATFHFSFCLVKLQ